MPGAEIAQYGIATFALAGVFYFMVQILKQRNNSSITEVIKNNTRAMEQVTKVVQAIQISLTRQEAKIDELLERARRQNGKE